MIWNRDETTKLTHSLTHTNKCKRVMLWTRTRTHGNCSSHRVLRQTPSILVQIVWEYCLKLYTSILLSQSDRIEVFRSNDSDTQRKKIISSTIYKHTSHTHIKKREKGTHTHILYLCTLRRANGFTLYAPQRKIFDPLFNKINYYDAFQMKNGI